MVRGSDAQQAMHKSPMPANAFELGKIIASII
jgi:hypothetical protein